MLFGIRHQPARQEIESSYVLCQQRCNVVVITRQMPASWSSSLTLLPPSSTLSLSLPSTRPTPCNGRQRQDHWLIRQNVTDVNWSKGSRPNRCVNKVDPASTPIFPRRIWRWKAAEWQEYIHGVHYPPCRQIVVVARNQVGDSNFTLDPENTHGIHHWWQLASRMWRLLHLFRILVAPLVPKGSDRANTPTSQGQFR